MCTCTGFAVLYVLVCSLRGKNQENNCWRKQIKMRERKNLAKYKFGWDQNTWRRKKDKNRKVG